MKQQKGMVFFHKKDEEKYTVHFIAKNGSFIAIPNAFQKIDNREMREYIMKNAKHITSNYFHRVIANKLRQDAVGGMTWLSDTYFTEKKKLDYDFYTINLF